MQRLEALVGFIVDLLRTREKRGDSQEAQRDDQDGHQDLDHQHSALFF